MYCLPTKNKREVANRLVIYLKSTVTTFLSDNVFETNTFLKSLAIPIRRSMESVENQFDGCFESNCQVNSVPVQLLTLISLLLDEFSVDNKGYSQPTLTCAQLIMSNFRKNSRHNREESTHKRNVKVRETPIKLFATLKLYAMVKSKGLIDTFFKMGICLSYDRVLELKKIGSRLNNKINIMLMEYLLPVILRRVSLH